MLPAPLALLFNTPFIKAHQGPKLPLDGAFERCAALVETHADALRARAREFVPLCDCGGERA